MGIVWCFLIIRSADNGDQLLELSTIAVISLLPVYHRFYDASLLIFPLAWSFAALSGPLRTFAKLSILLTLPFLLPGGSALEQLQQHTHHFTALQHSYLWTATVMPHQAWCLLFLSLLLLQALHSVAQRRAVMESVRA